MPGDRKTITVPYIAPIPVGHRIELRFFNEEKGVFKKHKELNASLPLIRDLDFGIEYGHIDHYKHLVGFSAVPLPPHEYPLTPRTDLDWCEARIARVASCRVLTEAWADEYQAQTTLVVEHEA